MKRVEVNMEEELRGKVADYAKEEDLTMPQAYGELLEKGANHVADCE